MPKKKIDEVKGSQNTQIGNEDKSNEVQGGQHFGYGAKKNPYFNFDCFKPDCYSARNFKLTRKASRLAIDTQKVIDQNFKELNEAKKSTRSNGTDSGFQRMGRAETIQDPHETEEISDPPKFEDVFLEESSHSMVIDSRRKEISFDLLKNKHHVLNQHSANDILGEAMRQKKMLKIILDS